ncbi:hypothetical protein [Massilia horti]|uniref:Uncharacterized protein n=1 Tax=Massilia horti TaxID=2562153 RepID=A0A4Y9T0R7_9BURK|nr:hypothetical protein [Massilia horti]TFW32872.1 hypothetical protein E4O92_08065 [Massilia horti]
MKAKHTYLYLLLFVSGAAFADDTALTKCRTLPDAASRLACYDAIPTGPASAPAPAQTVEKNFGLKPVAKPATKPVEETNSIESTIVGDFDGWSSNARIKLANGQVWRVVDGSEAYLPGATNPKVKIVRNMFGTLFLKIEGTNQSPKVRREE